MIGALAIALACYSLGVAFSVPLDGKYSSAFAVISGAISLVALLLSIVAMSMHPYFFLVLFLLAHSPFVLVGVFIVASIGSFFGRLALEVTSPFNTNFRLLSVRSLAAFVIVTAFPVISVVSLYYTSMERSKEMAERHSPENAFFYRVTADYIVRDTGQEINFDIVVACGTEVTSWIHTSSSYLVEWYPSFMAKPTQDDAAIGIRVPQLCEHYAWGLNSRTGEPDPKFASNPPNDFLPSTIWYPDVTNLGFGIGYEADFAYESKFSKLEFIGANLSKSNYAEWKQWREQQAFGYLLKGGIPGPWGYSFWTEPAEVAEEVRSRNNGSRIAGRHCASVVKLPIPKEVSEDMWKAAPESVERYWIPKYDHPNINFIRELQSRMPYQRGTYGNHVNINDELGVRRQSGDFKNVGVFYWEQGGRVVHPRGQGNFYHDVFPVVLTQVPTLEAKADPSKRHQLRIVLEEAWKGFSFCGQHDFTLSEIEEYSLRKSPRLDVSRLAISELNGTTHTPTDVYINDEFMFSSNRRIRAESMTRHIFDREGPYYNCCYHR